MLAHYLRLHLYSNVYFNINGSVVGHADPSRGLRQGCPLSPYLFLICTKDLSSLIRKDGSNDTLIGFSSGAQGPRVDHLFFTEDSLLFCKEKIDNLETLRKILDTYAAASGQVVNFQKSAINFSRNVDDEFEGIAK